MTQALMIISGRGRSSAARMRFFSSMLESSPGVASEKTSKSLPRGATEVDGLPPAPAGAPTPPELGGLGDPGVPADIFPAAGVAGEEPGVVLTVVVPCGDVMVTVVAPVGPVGGAAPAGAPPPWALLPAPPPWPAPPVPIPAGAAAPPGAADADPGEPPPPAPPAPPPPAELPPKAVFTSEALR